ncbi:Phosphoglycerate transport system sensor protein pgtB [Serratia fonticola]|uniref:Phosphoglycerate transport system sensor protein pgtB n=1 Tax=Serratia fonticola TaxID=47917 RepID=A0A4U9WFF4_SERFO|nr:Phosphoglycerate transport system sensor protein pgtB [Serratia fonticola]
MHWHAIENQIVDALTRLASTRLQSGSEEPTSVAEHVPLPFAYLQKTANESMQGLQAHPSTITLRQTIDELLETGIAENSMPAAMKNYHQAQRALTLAYSGQGGPRLPAFARSWNRN